MDAGDDLKPYAFSSALTVAAHDALKSTCAELHRESLVCSPRRSARRRTYPLHDFTSNPHAIGRSSFLLRKRAERNFKNARQFNEISIAPVMELSGEQAQSSTRIESVRTPSPPSPSPNGSSSRLEYVVPSTLSPPPSGNGSISGADNKYVFGGREDAYTPLKIAAMASSLPDLWRACSIEYSDVVALEDPHRETPVSLTFSQLHKTIQTFASGLQSLGLKAGDKVSLFADNSHRWFISDQGIMAAGCVDAVRGSNAPPEELSYILQHSQSVALVVDNMATLRRLLPFVPSSVTLKFVVVLWGDVSSSEVPCPVISYSDMLAKGSRHTFTPVVLRRIDLATLIYTSGTTGKPKGVKLSHGNVLYQVEHVGSVLKPRVGYKVLSLLPTWHIYERTGEYFFLAHGCTQVYTSLTKFRRDLATYRPQMFCAVPRVFEKFHQTLTTKFAQEPPLKRALINLFLAVSTAYVAARRLWQNREMRRTPATGLERLRGFIVAMLLFPIHALGDKIVFKKIREGLGGRIVCAMSGGGSLAAYLDDFFEVCGVEILVGYGLTETSPVLAARRQADNVRITTGPPMAGTEIKIVDPDTFQALPQGETGLVMARGPGVMVGYHRDAEATSNVLSRDGWFNTGDRGWFTCQGALVLTGRFKDTIVLTNGENIEPQPIEDSILESPLIDQIMLVGQDEKCLGALIVPNLDALRLRASPISPIPNLSLSPRPPTPKPQPPVPPPTSTTTSSRHHHQSKPHHHPRTDLQAVIAKLDLPEGATLTPEEVEQIFHAEVSRLVESRPNFRADERISQWRLVLDPFTEENGLLTQTLKIKRVLVFDKYSSLIKDMYHSHR